MNNNNNPQPLSLDAGQVQGIDRSEEDHNIDLQSLAKGLVVSRLSDLKDRVVTEVQQLKDRQSRVRLMHDMMRAVNESSSSSSKSSDGSIDASSERFEQIRKKADELLRVGNELMEKAEALEKEGKTAEAKALREEASEMIEVARALDAGKSKTTYTKDEKDKMLESLRLACEDLSTVNQLQTQTVSRLNNELHETLLIGRDIMKKVHEIITLMARGIRGG